MKTLLQKKNFITREFRLGESKLFFHYVRYGIGEEMDIPYENIDGERVRAQTNNYFVFYAGLAAIIFGLILMIFGLVADLSNFTFLGALTAVCGLPLIAYYWFTKENLWKIKLSNGTYLHFHKAVPNKDNVEEFLTELIKKRDDFLIDTYGAVDKNLGYEDQLNTFKWLKAIRAIDAKEFESKVDELKNTVVPEKHSIGYGK